MFLQRLQVQAFLQAEDQLPQTRAVASAPASQRSWNLQRRMNLCFRQWPRPSKWKRDQIIQVRTTEIRTSRVLSARVSGFTLCVPILSTRVSKLRCFVFSEGALCALCSTVRLSVKDSQCNCKNSSEHHSIQKFASLFTEDERKALHDFASDEGFPRMVLKSDKEAITANMPEIPGWEMKHSRCICSPKCFPFCIRVKCGSLYYCMCDSLQMKTFSRDPSR